MVAVNSDKSKLIEPDPVIWPSNPTPVFTWVTVPCGLLNEVDSVPPSFCVKVIVVVELPESLIPEIVLSYALFHSVELPPLA